MYTPGNGRKNCVVKKKVCGCVLMKRKVKSICSDMKIVKTGRSNERKVDKGRGRLTMEEEITKEEWKKQREIRMGEWQ